MQNQKKRTWTDKQTDEVTLSLKELLIAAKNQIQMFKLSTDFELQCLSITANSNVRLKSLTSDVCFKLNFKLSTSTLNFILKI